MRRIRANTSGRSVGTLGSLGADGLPGADVVAGRAFEPAVVGEPAHVDGASPRACGAPVGEACVAGRGPFEPAAVVGACGAPAGEACVAGRGPFEPAAVVGACGAPAGEACVAGRGDSARIAPAGAAPRWGSGPALEPSGRDCGARTVVGSSRSGPRTVVGGSRSGWRTVVGGSRSGWRTVVGGSARLDASVARRGSGPTFEPAASVGASSGMPRGIGARTTVGGSRSGSRIVVGALCVVGGSAGVRTVVGGSGAKARVWTTVCGAGVPRAARVGGSAITTVGAL